MQAVMVPHTQAAATVLSRMASVAEQLAARGNQGDVGDVKFWQLIDEAV